MCRVLRSANLSIELLIFVRGDVGHNMNERIVEATGHPAIPIKKRSALTDLINIAGLSSKQLQRQLDSYDIDVIFEASGYIGNQMRQPVISWIPDFQHRHFRHLFSRIGWLARELRFRRILSTRKFVIVSSNDAHNDLLRFYPKANSQLSVVPFSIHLEYQIGADDLHRVQLKYDIPSDYIYLPNQYWAHKNHQLVVDALSHLEDSRPVVISTGNPVDPQQPERVEKLMGKIADLGLANHFRILGNLPYQDILALNFGATALINPSFFEGWSTTVEEAKALGTPMLLSDLAVHKEQAGGLALYFDPHSPLDCAEKLQQMVCQPPVRFREKATETNRINLQNYAQKLIALFDAAHRSGKTENA